MSKPRATPAPNARYRVQAPEAPMPKSRGPPFKESAPAAPSGPSLSKRKRLPLSTLLTTLRQRFSALPSPIRRAGRTLRWLAPVIPIALYFPEHVMQVMWVRGPSMTPYLNEDYEQSQTKSDIVLVSMWPWGSIIPFLKPPRLERGMVVTFRSPANSSHIAIKRIVGLPGDRITTREPCMRPTQIVPWNHVWLEGDAQDPRKTMDSNTYGPVSLSLVTGRVWAVLGPRMRWLDWKDWETDNDDAVSIHRKSVRDRVVKDAVKLEQPFLN
ncbi:unnamed protein product [Penicillium salamii]|uniref:Mitochondrial inner membrane protease subunit 2 n=1 Tax=Penicillium salamii TaxID=1612424 RepID=A0A9W4JKA0_9EURO|nr:unnamed protein product [Penicillium salamii]CAG8404565.1 unnamed protein product [Penicillium salamii]CAG8411206.1 unnamed protein product [Penicillium salamii]